MRNARLSQAMPEKPGRHLHVPERPSQLPFPEHINTPSCGDVPHAGFGFAVHATPVGHLTAAAGRSSASGR